MPGRDGDQRGRVRPTREFLLLERWSTPQSHDRSGGRRPREWVQQNPGGNQVALSFNRKTPIGRLRPAWSQQSGWPPSAAGSSAIRSCPGTPKTNSTRSSASCPRPCVPATGRSGTPTIMADIRAWRTRNRWCSLRCSSLGACLIRPRRCGRSTSLSLPICWRGVSASRPSAGARDGRSRPVCWRRPCSCSEVQRQAVSSIPESS